MRLRQWQALWQASLSQDNLPQYDKWLSQQFRGEKKFGAKDRRWYSEMLFAAMRFGYFATFAAFSRGRSLDAASLPALAQEFAAVHPGHHRDVLAAWRAMEAPVFMALVLMRYQWVGTEDVGPYLEALAPAPGLTQHMQDLAAVMQSPQAPLSLQMLWAGVPLWMEEDLRTGFCELAPDFLAMQASRPPLWLRYNQPQQAEAIRASLTDSYEILTEEGQAVAVRGTQGVFTLPLYRDGLIEIQDWASQQLALAVAAAPGDFVWDACAGGGGKTMAIASRMANRGAIYASDIRAYKLDELRQRARRAGFLQVRCMPWQGEASPTFPKEVQRRGGFDWVLVDAPCSSSGTWRRNPDAKYRVDAASLQQVQAEQAMILRAAAPAVKAGGFLVYATCSWLPGENAGQVASFLAANSHFRLVRQALVGAPTHDADTMFFAVLQRTE